MPLFTHTPDGNPASGEGNAPPVTPVDGGGSPPASSDPHWLDGYTDSNLDTEVADFWRTQEKATDLNAALKTGMNAEKLMGRSVRLPGDDVQGDERAAILREGLNKLGHKVPETADGYQVELPERFQSLVPQGISDEEKAKIQAFAHKSNMSQDQLNAFLEFELETFAAQEAARVAADEQRNNRATEDLQMAQAATREALQADVNWAGQAFDRSLAMAKQAAEQIGDKDLLEKVTLANDVGLLKMAHALAVARNLGHVVTGEPTPREVGKSNTLIEYASMR